MRGIKIVELTLVEVISCIQNSRKHFLKHLNGLTADQWDWKPYAECKSIRETISHLMGDDLAALESLQSGIEPDYTVAESKAAEMASDNTTELLKQLADTHTTLCDALRSQCADSPLDASICVWGHDAKIATGIPYYSSEDYYHSGQVAFIRMATDPTWDYYTSVDGG